MRRVGTNEVRTGIGWGTGRTKKWVGQVEVRTDKVGKVGP